MSDNVNSQEEVKISAAGRPDFGKLAMFGVNVQLGSDGAPIGNAKTPKTGERSITIRVDGVKTKKNIAIMSGHAMNPDFPGWRAGLNPEKYHQKVMLEVEARAVNKKKTKIAPDLTVEESQLYLTWLQEQGIVASTEAAFKTIEDAKKEVLGNIVAKAEKQVGKKPKAEKQENVTTNEETDEAPKRGRPKKSDTPTE